MYSLMLVFDTMGTSSPEMVPAVGGKEFVFRALTFGADLRADTELKRITMNASYSIELLSRLRLRATPFWVTEQSFIVLLHMIRI